MKNKFLIALLTISSLFVSCRKERRDTLGASISTDNSTAENLFSDMFKVVEDVSMNTEGIREDIIGCIDTVIVDTTSNPKTVLIDFGDNNCVGYDGRVRKGKLHVTYTGRYREIGTEITITPENYTVNGNLIEGQKIIQNLGINANGQLHYSVVAWGTITAAGNAWTVTWQAERTRTWVEGQSTPTLLDDVYEITGYGNGVNRNGVSYTTMITQPLRAEIGCPWLVSGSITIEPEPEEYSPRFIDFGDGACDNDFTVTVNGQVYELGFD